MINIKNICKKFNAQVILDNVSFDIRKNQITSIKAPSGSGKTTLINIILGLTSIDSGEIVNLPKEISIVFQEDRLVECITPAQNVLLCNPDVSIKDAVNFLQNIGISNDKIVSELSGGMKRRVSLARALMNKADFLILDEPFYGIDEQNKKKIMDLIKQTAKNKTILLITHDERDIEYFGLNKITKVDQFCINTAEI